MITMAERRFPVRIRLGVPPGGFGQPHTNITAWLGENCDADGWAMTPSGMRRVLNDAVSTELGDRALPRTGLTTFHQKFPLSSPDSSRRSPCTPQALPRLVTVPLQAPQCAPLPLDGHRTR
jgi:hypothetical protein